jgi:hypothetical protein
MSKLDYERMGIRFDEMPRTVTEAARLLIEMDHDHDPQRAADHLTCGWQVLLEFGIKNLIDSLEEIEKEQTRLASNRNDS